MIFQGRSVPTAGQVEGRLRTRLSLTTQVSRSPLAENALTVRQKRSQIVRKVVRRRRHVKEREFPSVYED